MDFTDELTQEDILLTLVQGVEGKEWAEDMNGWEKNGDDSVCEWDGVICNDEDDTVIEGLDLNAVGLSATIPSELGRLITLRQISMPQNIIRGTIPIQIANLPHLETIDLSENELTGEFPLFKSPSLTTLNLAHNLLSGTLPKDIGQRHGRMTVFDITHNEIEGPLPESFSYMTQLDSLSLTDNKLSGTVPSALGMAANLHFLYINGNYLMGTVPPGLARLDSPLEELWIQRNLLSGTVPAAIADLPNLYNLYIDGNKFTGTIPRELCRKELNEDFFEGAPDEATRDYCESVACPVGSFSYDGLFPCKPCPTKFSDPYLGRTGSCIDLNQSDILNILYKSLSVDQWSSFDPEGAQNADWCRLPAITCDNNFNVIALDLKGMDLSGTIPDEIGFLEYLQRLDLSDNGLTGFIPSDLRWAPLETLELGGNQFKGIVPPMLCLKPGINGNGDGGQYGCEHIACPVGTYSSTGYGTVIGNGEKCKGCPSSAFLASKTCHGQAIAARSPRKKPLEEVGGGGIFGIVLLVLIVVGAAGFMAVRKIRSKKDKVQVPQDDELHYMTEIEVHDDVEFS